MKCLEDQSRQAVKELSYCTESFPWRRWDRLTFFSELTQNVECKRVVYIELHSLPQTKSLSGSPWWIGAGSLAICVWCVRFVLNSHWSWTAVFLNFFIVEPRVLHDERRHWAWVEFRDWLRERCIELAAECSIARNSLPWPKWWLSSKFTCISRTRWMHKQFSTRELLKSNTDRRRSRTSSLRFWIEKVCQKLDALGDHLLCTFRLPECSEPFIF